MHNELSGARVDRMSQASEVEMHGVRIHGVPMTDLYSEKPKPKQQLDYAGQLLCLNPSLDKAVFNSAPRELRC